MFRLFASLFVSCCLQFVSSNKQISLFGIYNLNDTIHVSIAAAQWLAVQQINFNASFLPDYTLKLNIADSNSKAHTAVINTIKISHLDQNNNSHCSSNINTIFPITLSGTRSSIAALTGSILNAFNIGHISSSATSTDLSNKEKYPYFYRTIPSDEIQANGLILLCKIFNWTRIAVVYIHDTYGLSLALEIQKIATTNKTNINVTAIAIDYSAGKTYLYAAKLIKRLNIFIVIGIIHTPNEIQSFFQTFDRANMLTYPYYFIGVDAWIHSSFIEKINIPSLKNKVGGFIGCTPWQSNSLHINQYDNDIVDIINTSIQISSDLYESWKYYQKYSDNNKIRNLEQLEGNYVSYAYDALYTIAHAIETMDKHNHSLLQMFQQHPKQFIYEMNKTIIETTNFIGASGHILFDKNGDRINGLYAFGNTLTNLSIQYFGYFYKTLDGEYKYNINKSAIVWPNEFVNKSLIPQSDIITYKNIIKLDHTAPEYACISIVTNICIVITIILISMLIYYRKNRIIKATHVSLNILMCMGCILGFGLVLLTGMDETATDMYTLKILCNVRLCIACLAYTIIFMPMFFKSYRLHRIVNNGLRLQKTQLTDGTLFKCILLCLLIDIILLAIFFGIEPFERVYVKTNVIIIDELQQQENGYTSCQCNTYSWFVVVVIFCWKLLQHIFGFFIVMNLSRISGERLQQQIARFDETGIQLVIIIFTFVLMCIAVTVVSLKTSSPKFYFLFLSIVFLLTINLCLLLTILPRFIAICTNNENKFDKSEGKKLEEKLQFDIRKLLDEQEALMNLNETPLSRRKVTFTMPSDSISDVIKGYVKINTNEMDIDDESFGE